MQVLLLLRHSSAPHPTPQLSPLQSRTQGSHCPLSLSKMPSSVPGTQKELINTCKPAKENHVTFSTE